MSSSGDKFSPHSHIPYGADGSGFYSDNTIGCYNVILETAPLILQSIKSASVKPGSVFTIADYGCADGGTSMPLLYACVKELRKIHGDNLPIHVVYEDQPVNDFKSLFLRLQGLIPGPKSYLQDFPNVFVTACGTNFYNQCLPPQSVNLIFSSTAMHWLRDKPCDVSGALHHTMITVPEEEEKFKNQAAKDWETLLLARAKELAPGGRMVLVQFVVDEEGQYLGTTKNVPVSMHHTMRDLWKGLVDDGLITQSPHSHIPYGKDGSGYYSDNAPVCTNAISASEPLVLDAIRSATVKPGSVFTIADYGCADGGTSMLLMYACVKELRNIHGDELAINVVYEDQPVNDFKSLFLRLQGLMPGPKSYLLDFPNVFVTACGTTFYSQCLPPQTVNLAFSASAMHWLRQKPCNVKGAFHHMMVGDPETAEKLKKQAAEDWELLLLQRAKELAPGSSMILVQLALDEEGQCSGFTKSTTVSTYYLMRDLWQGFVAEGLITQEEFDQTIFAFRIRTVDEFKKPFESEDSPVCKAGLSLVSIETRMIPCPYKKKWLKDGGDPLEHARSYIMSMRRWSNATFINGLSNTRSAEDKEKIVDELFKRYELEVAKRPEDHGHDFISAYMVIKKA